MAEYTAMEVRELRERRTSLLFIAIFSLVLCYPLHGYLFDKIFTLSGITAEEGLRDVDIESVMDESFQSGLNTWIENRFLGCGILIKPLS